MLNRVHLYLIKYLISHPIVTTKRRVQEQSNIDQTTGTSNTGKNVIAKAMMNALVKEYLDT